MSTSLNLLLYVIIICYHFLEAFFSVFLPSDILSKFFQGRHYLSDLNEMWCKSYSVFISLWLGGGLHVRKLSVTKLRIETEPTESRIKFEKPKILCSFLNP